MPCPVGAGGANESSPSFYLSASVLNKVKRQCLSGKVKQHKKEVHLNEICNQNALAGCK